MPAVWGHKFYNFGQRLTNIQDGNSAQTFASDTTERPISEQLEACGTAWGHVPSMLALQGGVWAGVDVYGMPLQRPSRLCLMRELLEW